MQVQIVPLIRLNLLLQLCRHTGTVTLVSNSSPQSLLKYFFYIEKELFQKEIDRFLKR